MCFRRLFFLEGLLGFLQLLILLLVPSLSFFTSRLSNLLHLSRLHYFRLDLTLLLSIHHRQNGHHAFPVINKDLALLAFRLLHAGRCDHVQSWQSEFFVCVDSLPLLFRFHRIVCSRFGLYLLRRWSLACGFRLWFRRSGSRAFQATLRFSRL